MVIAQLNSKSIFLDTAPLIYFIEGHSVYQPVLAKLFNENDNGQITFITSTITILEVMVGPLRSGRQDIAIAYQKLLTETSGIEVIDISSTIAITAAELRARYNLKTPDAIQLATAIENGADCFLTNDHKLKNITAIQVLTLSDLE